MDPLIADALLVIGGFVAGVLNVLAGGGSLLTLPLLLFTGHPALLANGTNRVAILVQGVVATAGFRSGGEDGLREGLRLAIPMTAGAVAGAAAALALGPVRFQRALGVILLVMAVIVLLRRPPATAPPHGAHRTGARRRGLLLVSMLALGFYAGFVQAGVGVLLLAALVALGGHRPVHANAIKIVVIATSTVVSLAIYAAHGEVDWRAGTALALGMGAGGWSGARLQLGDGGERWVRRAVAVAVLAAAVKLLADRA